MYPSLPDELVLREAIALRLRNPRAAISNETVRRAVELSHWARKRAHDERLRRMLGAPQFKRVSAGDIE